MLISILDLGTLGPGGGPRLGRRVALAAAWVGQAAPPLQESAQPQQIFSSFAYVASRWDQPRCVIVKAERTAQGLNLRLVVVNVPGTRGSPTRTSTASGVRSRRSSPGEHGCDRFQKPVVEGSPRERLRSFRGGSRKLFSPQFVPDQVEGMFDQLIRRFPEQAIDTVADDLNLAAAAVDQGDAACRHRLDRRDAEVLEFLRVRLLVLPVPLGMPEERGFPDAAVYLMAREVREDLDRVVPRAVP